MLLRIASVPPPRGSSDSDLVYWGFSADGRFTTKSAYEGLFGIFPKTDTWLWRVIWKWGGPQRIRQFMWLVANNRLMTNSERFRRYLAPSPTCELCGAAPETLLHTLRDCPKAAQIWRKQIPGNKLPAFFALELRQWMGYNLCSGDANDIEDWSCTFGVTIWRIWHGRNCHIFRNEEFHVGNRLREVNMHVMGIKAAILHGEKILGDSTTRVSRMIRWIAPPEGWFKMNSDGAFNASTGMATAGGLIRNSYGQWVRGFTMNIGFTTVAGAELWGLFQGLRLAWELGLSRVIASVDNQGVVQMINGGHEGSEYKDSKDIIW
ncbi:Polynucleotidyl transferase- ribonuclease H-like superfamily protein [Striga hermonthica]|uniref:Polynucleotidyl transferase- ribonuclease H-like superfamily protein n=1 Tax=Striga hermonthica TaxID=68872 RepID=A0A9N7R8G9_STRHE|nr:Polynucleotidyl transferase- ribonuclease H-like superfamily protein [Striga hermonthica]